jgi:UPF0271 protein
MILILDTSAFLSGKFTSIPKDQDVFITTSLVENEIRKGAPSRLFANLLESGLKLKDPSSLEDARSLASSTGDLEALSETDLSIIALATEFEDVLVITDDFRIQNVLKSAGIPFEHAGEVGDRTIREVWSWTFRCRGCGRFFNEGQKNDECPICGSEVRRTRRK